MESILKIVQGNLLEQDVEAIVNAANSFLEGGGGIDGLIHNAAGPELVEACRQVKKAHHISHLEVGGAILTPAFNISHIKAIIHTVGPNCSVLSQEKQKASLLKKAYQSSLEVAREEGLRSIAFPAISTGIYRYPFEEAQKVAFEAILAYLDEHPGHFSEIRLVYYALSDFERAQQVWIQMSV